MLDALIFFGLTLVGIFVSQYALGTYLRLKKVFVPLTEEIKPQIHNQDMLKKMLNKQKTERIMLLGMFFVLPLMVVVFSAGFISLLPYFIGVAVGAWMLRGKTGPDYEQNLYLYFYNYRLYLQNEKSLREDPAYKEYLTYRRSSLVEQALDADEKKRIEKARAQEK